ncbi:hypothetical protein PTSG_04491 [Salpingoeca rosetta]|uniref:Anaphase-promoting complex subunit 4-like WD40 domain-containing protein n=1 Tax=Salpingoeca rosetta (strain ATCC 50818 / BSB-021) TaxID=946362 RepID=F2U8Q3_SALR5|nr:uncharacterized protein PTSG_04491 [Salpingoeca rosetta]EGD72761.1 hypothetical protein PTSG_04491 [Salpingoeca rosetta]|eukprot:XP_004994584.1 hypothetical protein PTSG_04491 [Salpingoeca rosetta]
MFKIIGNHSQAHDDGIWTIAWSKDGSNTILSGSVDDTVKVWRWDHTQLELRHRFEGHNLGVLSVDIDGKGETAVSSSIDSVINVWDLNGGKLLKSIDTASVNTWTTSLSPDGRYIASGSNTNEVHLFSVESGKSEGTVDTGGKFTSAVKWSPDNQHLACAGMDGTVSLFNTEGKLQYKFGSDDKSRLHDHSKPVRGLSFSPDGSLLYTACDDGYIKMFDVRSGKIAGSLSGHSSWVLCVDASIDGEHIVTGSSDKTVKVWNIKERQCEHTFDDHTDQVWAVSFDHTGKCIASGSDDQAIIIYECPWV